MIWPSGEMSIAFNTADVTVSTAVPLTEPEVAVMVAAPAPAPLARPAGSMVAKFEALELHETLFVMSVVLPSEKTPFAANAWVCPVANEAGAVVTWIELSNAADTLAVAERLTEPNVAVMFAEPADTPVTSP